MGSTFLDLVAWLRKQFDTIVALLLPLWLVVAWIAGMSLLSLWFEARQHLMGAGLVEAPPAAELVVVALDEVFAEHYDYPKETPKAYLAEIIRTVAAQEPRVVVLDYWFTDADRTAPGFEAIVEAVAEAPPSVQFVFPTRLLARADGPLLLDVPPAPLRRHVLTGYADLRGDPVFDQSLVTSLGGSREVAPSLTLAALAAWTFPEVAAEAQAFVESGSDRAAVTLPIETWQAVGELLAMEDTEEATLGGWTRLLRSYGLTEEQASAYGINHRDHFAPGSAGVVGSEDLRRGTLPPPVLASLLRDRLVVIGSTYPLDSDTFTTPFGKRRGVLVHAATLHSLLAERPVQQTGWVWGVVAALIALVVAVVVVWLLPPKQAVVAAAVTVLGYLLAHFGLFVVADRLLPLAWPLVGGVAGLHLAHRKWLVQKVRRDGPPLPFALRLAPATTEAWVPGAGLHVTVEVAPGDERPAEQTRLVLEEVISRAATHKKEGSKEDASQPLPLTLGDGLHLVRRGTTDATVSRAVGQALYAGLFPGKVKQVYHAARAQATRRLSVRRPLHLDLHLADSALSVVPWAIATDPKGTASLVALPGLRVVYRIARSGIEHDAALNLDAPLGRNALVHLWHSSSSPEGPQNPGQLVVDSAYDRARFDAALHAVPSLLVRDFGEEGTGTTEAVHLLGQCVMHEGHARWVTGEGLADAPRLAARLQQARGLRVLALDSVRPSADPSDAALPRFAAEVVATLGVAVIAVPATVGDTTRAAFWRGFYAHAMEHSPAEACARARQPLAAKDPAAALIVCILPESV